jgi:ketosteroid isomerase-like protein
VEATIRAYFDGINSERYDDVGRLFAPDGELSAPGTPVRRGAEDIADYFRAALKPYPEHLDDPTRIIVAGNTVTVEIHYTGALENGARVEFDAIDVFDLDDEARIVRLSSWYDSHGVRKMVRAAREQAV